MTYARLMRRLGNWERALVKDERRLVSAFASFFWRTEAWIWGFVMNAVCTPFFLRPGSAGYDWLRRTCEFSPMTRQEYRLRRRRSAIGAATLAGIVGLTMLRPILVNNRYDLPRVRGTEAFDGTYWEIYLDTDTGSFATNNKMDNRAVRTGGRLAVWQELSSKGWQIILFDVGQNKTFQLTDEPGEHTMPQTDGRYVIWQSKTDGTWQIFVYDTKTPDQPPQPVSEGGRNAIHPRISQGRAVWQQWDGTHWQVVVWEIGKAYRQLTNDNYHNISPDILGTLVTWLAATPDGPRVFVEEINSRKREILDSSSVAQIAPSFSDGTLHWHAYGQDGSYSEKYYNFLNDDFGENVIVNGVAPAETATSTAPTETATSTTPTETATSTAPTETATSTTPTETATSTAPSDTSSSTTPAGTATSTTDSGTPSSTSM